VETSATHIVFIHVSDSTDSPLQLKWIILPVNRILCRQSVLEFCSQILRGSSMQSRRSIG